jgi:nitrate/nitrite-specific signal transduction histidine kinase
MPMAKPEQPWDLDETGRKAIGRLQAVIEKHQQATERQTTVMVRLTWWIAILTAVMVIPAVVEIWRWIRAIG